MRTTETRHRMIEAAVRLFRRHGYHGVGLMEIVKEGRAPRGSIYHHFPGGKEELAMEAIQAGGRRISEVFERAAQRSRTATQLVQEIGREFATGLEESGYTDGCPLATLTLETAPASPVLGAASAAAYAGWARVLSTRLEELGVPVRRSRNLAMLALSAWGGALVMSRAACRTDPLRIATLELARLARLETDGTRRVMK